MKDFRLGMLKHDGTTFARYKELNQEMAEGTPRDGRCYDIPCEHFGRPRCRAFPLPASAARMAAVELLLAAPESLGDDVLESCLYLLRERLRAA